MPIENRIENGAFSESNNTAFDNDLYSGLQRQDAIRVKDNLKPELQDFSSQDRLSGVDIGSNASNLPVMRSGFRDEPLEPFQPSTLASDNWSTRSETGSEFDSTIFPSSSLASSSIPSSSVPTDSFATESLEARVSRLENKVDNIESAPTITDKANTALAGAKETVTPYVQTAKETVTPYVQTAKETVTPYVQSAKETITPYVQSAKETITPYVQSAKDSIASTVEGAKGYLSKSNTATDREAVVEYDAYGAPIAQPASGESLISKITHNIQEGAQIGLAKVESVIHSLKGDNTTAAVSSTEFDSSRDFAVTNSSDVAPAKESLLVQIEHKLEQGAQMGRAAVESVISTLRGTQIDDTSRGQDLPSLVENRDQTQLSSPLAASTETTGQAISRNIDTAKTTIAATAQNVKERAVDAYQTAREVVTDKLSQGKQVAVEKQADFKQMAAEKQADLKETFDVKSEQFKQMLSEQKDHLHHVAEPSTAANFNAAKSALESQFKAAEANAQYHIEKASEMPDDSFKTTVGHKFEEGKQMGIAQAETAKAEIRKKQLDAQFKISDL